MVLPANIILFALPFISIFSPAATIFPETLEFIDICPPAIKRSPFIGAFTLTIFANTVALFTDALILTVPAETNTSRHLQYVCLLWIFCHRITFVKQKICQVY